MKPAYAIFLFACAGYAQQIAPTLTIAEAVSLALGGNRQVESSQFAVHAAHQETAAQKTSYLPQFQAYVVAGETLRPITFTVPRGALGDYAATGLIPAENTDITTPKRLTGLIFAQASQPLSQLWKIHLSVVASRIAEDLAKESLRQQRQDAAHSVRNLYYQIVQTQTQIETAEANEKYLVELDAETDRQFAQQTALKADTLSVKAKLSQQRYQLLTLRDSLATQKESMNRLLGRDLEIPFSVEVQTLPSASELDLAAARRQALEERSEVRQAHLQSAKAGVAIRQERAEYIPDISASLSYFTLPNVNFVPQNILNAGFILQWQPFDWGQKYHKTSSLRDSAKEAELSAQDAEQQVAIDVNSKFRALAETRAQLDTAALTREAEREKLRVVSNRFSQKAALLSDVLSQESALASAESGYQSAIAAFWQAKAAFDRALGKE